MITLEKAREIVKQVRGSLDSFDEYPDAWVFFDSQEGDTTASTAIAVMKEDGSWKLPVYYFMGDAGMDPEERDWDKLVFTVKTSSDENEYVVDTKHEYESYKFRSSNKSRYNILAEKRLEEIEDVICDVNLFEWEECYYLPAEDGSTWSVTIYKDDQVIFTSSGSNAYPEGYDKWKRFVRNFAIHGGGLVGTENGIILNVKHF